MTNPEDDPYTPKVLSPPGDLGVFIGCWGATEQKTGLRSPVVSLLKCRSALLYH
jgi:hypothetical protein